MAFEARLSRMKSALILLGSVMLFLGGLWMLGLIGPPVEPESTTDAIEQTVGGWVLVVCCSVSGLICAWRLPQSGVDIRIDAIGVYWRRWSATVIPWGAIEHIGLVELGRRRLVCLFLHDPADYPGRGLLGAAKRLARDLGSTRLGDVSLTAHGTDATYAELRAAVERYAPAGLVG